MATVIIPTPETLSELWSQPNALGTLSQPLLLAGDRLIGATDETVFAIDVYKGQPVGLSESVAKQNFPITLDDFFGGNPQVTALGSAVYYVGGDDGTTVLALRLADAQPIAGWAPPKIENLRSLVPAGDVLVAIWSDNSGAAFVSGFDPRTGGTAFGPVRLSDQSPGAVAFGNGAVFVLVSNTLKAVNTDFGDTRWQFSPAAGDAPLDITVTPLVTDKLVIVAAGDLIALDSKRGQRMWTVKASGQGGRWTAPAVDESGLVAMVTNSLGDVFGISLADGSILWSATAGAPGAVSVLGGDAFFTIDEGKNLARLACADGTPGGCYALPAFATGQSPVVGNGAIYLLSADGASIVARSFAPQDAAFFDGVKSRIDVLPDGTQLDFGLADFTVEAWFKTSVGGEIVSSYPTAGGASDHGFRLNLSLDGRFRVAILNESQQVVNAGRTLPTQACDGAWHHVAFMRREGVFVVLLDGRALTVRFPDAATLPLSIGGRNGLTIGAYVAGPDQMDAAEAHFLGLVREVRVWDRALDVATIQTNLKVELTGREPRLVGLWRLDENQPSAGPPKNAVPHHAYTASFVNAASVPTDLAMDDSAFPYLIHEAQPRWPYAGTWAARGENPITSQAALSADGTLAFATGNAIYAVRKADGKRVWSVSTAMGASGPVADGNSFLVMTGEDSLVRVDSTGQQRQVAGFSALTQGQQSFLPLPAVSGGWIAVATPDGDVYVGARNGYGADPSASPVKASLGQPMRAIAFTSAGLICVTGAAGSFQLQCLDPLTGQPRGPSIAMVSEEFCVAGNRLVCVQSDGIKGFDLARASAPSGSTAIIPAAQVSGLAANPDSDLLVVVTTGGEVHGLSLGKLLARWTQTIPIGPGGGGNIALRPAIDSAGRIYCGTKSGSFAVLDPENGAFLGFVTEPQAITTPAVLDDGTAYFGCADPADPTADCDGALHSFVFGQVIALRFGLDMEGSAATGTVHAEIAPGTAASSLHLMNVQQSCVEAWVNIPPAATGAARAGGGGVLGICPTDAADSFDLNLSIDPDGTIRYAARSKAAGGWSGLEAAAASSVCDGQWHHIAVSRDGESHAIVYVDGKALSGVTLTATATAPATVASGLKAYLGATAGADLAATDSFCGMIAEVRLWDTYLQSTEISDRMHVKLRGDEPDLLAYWNFDRQAVHDSSRQGNDGTIVGAGVDPVWWLTDLSFSLPSYPHILTAASVSQEGDPSGSGDARNTIYSLKVTVQRADKSAVPSQDIELWYVRHDPSEPESITVNGVALTGTDPGAAASGGTPAPSLKVPLRPDGTAALSVETSLIGHGPSIDVRAAFMPANERFHVSCLIDNQALAKPVPPSLTAQTKLIQDYHYSPGSVIDETRDRSTHRVVLTAANPDHSLRADEPITLWASAELVIEVAGTSYTLGPDNKADFLTSTHGELVVVVEASGFSTPSLYARAGFMHRNDRIGVSPDEDGHKRLAGLQPEDLTTPTLGNWKPNSTDSDKQTILSTDYAPHAGDIAQSVRHVMASVQPPPAAGAPAANVARRRALSAAAPASPQLFADMRQPRPPGRSDLARIYRTRANVLRKPPVNPDAMRASLGGNIGFVFAAGSDPSSFRFQLLATQEDVDRESAPARRPMMRSILGDIWDGIEDAAEDAYEAAQKLVVTVTDAVNVAIHTLEGVVNVVVDSIEKAVDAVVAFFKQLILAIELLILLLRALLDWGGIHAASELIRAMLESTGRQLADPATVKPITDAVGSFFDTLETTLGIDTSPMAGQSAADQPQDGSDAEDWANGVPAKMFFHKFQEHGDDAVIAGLAVPGLSDIPEFLQKMIADFGSGVTDIASDLSSMDFHAMATDLKALIQNLEQDALQGARSWTLQSIESLAKSFGGLVQLGDVPIDIPFISALYKWITGDDLTILGLLCFLLGFPVHVVYFVVTRGDRFSDEAKDWFPAQAPAPALRAFAADGPMAFERASALPDDSKSKEIVYVVLKVVHILFVIGTDATFSRKEKTKARAVLKIGRGLCGCFTTVWAWLFFFPQYGRVIQAFSDEHDLKVDTRSDLFEATRYLGLVIGLLSDGTTLFTGLRQVWPEGAQAPAMQGVELPALNAEPAGEAWPAADPQGFGNLETGRADTAELIITGVNALAAVGQIIFQIVQMVQQASWPDESPRTAAQLVRSRYICLSLPRLFGWMFTQTGAGDFLTKDPEVQIAVTATRAVANTTGLALHGTAAFNYLDL